MTNLTSIGRLATDPELKYAESGNAYCRFRLAVDRPRRSKDSEKKADFFTVTCWGQTAEFTANYLSKGRLVAVCGTLSVNEYEKDGVPRTSVEISATEIKALDKPKEAEG